MSLILSPEKTNDTASLFLTSFDPSDLPGSSIDPLGFERGYLFLADKILPGLTNVARYPRYFSVLCAGAYLAKVNLTDPPRLQYEKRLKTVLRLERFWALANVLAEGTYVESSLPTGGIRGVSYARKQVDRIDRRNIKALDANFRLLSRQMPYGVVGIYASNADGMRLIDRKTFRLTPDLGERLAIDFIESSKLPAALKKAVIEDGKISRKVLTEWGFRSHITKPLFQQEKLCIREAIVRNPVRARMMNCLLANPFIDEFESEQSRLEALLGVLPTSDSDRDLREAIDCILNYERCYQSVSLAFERLLWMCKHHSPSLNQKQIEQESIFESVCNSLPANTSLFCQSLDLGQTELFRQGLERLNDVRSFLEEASAARHSPFSLVQKLLQRHHDVQQGKFDKGRRKMPWIEEVGGQISLTMTHVGGLKTEATLSRQISTHPYRLRTAEAFLGATR